MCCKTNGDSCINYKRLGILNQTNHNYVSIMSPHIQNFIYAKENEP